MSEPGIALGEAGFLHDKAARACRTCTGMYMRPTYSKWLFRVTGDNNGMEIATYMNR